MAQKNESLQVPDKETSDPREWRYPTCNEPFIIDYRDKENPRGYTHVHLPLLNIPTADDAIQIIQDYYGIAPHKSPDITNFHIEIRRIRDHMNCVKLRGSGPNVITDDDLRRYGLR